MDALEGLFAIFGVNEDSIIHRQADELDTLRAENERLHARVSDLTARLRKCSEMHRERKPHPHDNSLREHGSYTGK